MGKPKCKRTPKAILRLPDLEHSKAAVLNSLTSPSSRRSYEHAIREFTDWYCSEPRLAFNKTVVTGTASSWNRRTMQPRQSTCDWPRFVGSHTRRPMPASSVLISLPASDA